MLLYPRPQDSESTASRLICEVNQSAAQLVPRWGTTRESQVLWFIFFFSIIFQFLLVNCISSKSIFLVFTFSDRILHIKTQVKYLQTPLITLYLVTPLITHKDSQFLLVNRISSKSIFLVFTFSDQILHIKTQVKYLQTPLITLYLVRHIPELKTKS